MPLGELLHELRCHHTAATAERRIFIVADQNVHIGVIRQMSDDLNPRRESAQQFHSRR